MLSISAELYLILERSKLFYSSSHRNIRVSKWFLFFMCSVILSLVWISRYLNTSQLLSLSVWLLMSATSIYINFQTEKSHANMPTCLSQKLLMLSSTFGFNLLSIPKRKIMDLKYCSSVPMLDSLL